MDSAHLQKFLDVVSEHRLSAFFRLAAYTGANRGEPLNLRWADVDLDVPQIRITGTTTVIEGKRMEGTTKGGCSRMVSLAPSKALPHQEGLWSCFGLWGLRPRGDDLDADYPAVLVQIKIHHGAVHFDRLRYAIWRNRTTKVDVCGSGFGIVSPRTGTLFQGQGSSSDRVRLVFAAVSDITGLSGQAEGP